MSFGPLTKKIAEVTGYPITEDGILDMLKAAVLDSVVPGICRACKEVDESVEPDARDNYCEHCGEARVQSVLIINGFI